MEMDEGFVEYYDELFPISACQKELYDSLIKQFHSPARLLRVGCGTGMFEHQLSREGVDVTGIEDIAYLLRSANLRRRTQLMTLRFFQMSYLDMSKFLGRGFYNIISCLDDRILFVHDTTLLKKFFFDSHELLSPGGILVLSLVNLSAFGSDTELALPERRSIRAALFSYVDRENGSSFLSEDLETGNGSIITVCEHERIHELSAQEIELFAREAGFSAAEFYSDYDFSPFTAGSEKIVAILRR